jgi:hypothetical protein
MTNAPLEDAERAIMSEYLTDTSKIVKTFSMQTLADIAADDPSLRGPIVARLFRLTQTGSPAMKSRGRKLLARLTRQRSRTGPRLRRITPRGGSAS